MRFPVEFLVLACLVVGILPAADDRARSCDMAARSVLGAGHARLQPGGLARLQPAAADERDRAGRRRRALPGAPAASAEGHRWPAADPRGSKAGASSSGPWSSSPGAGARTLERLFGTRRLQPQLRLLVCVAVAGRGLDRLPAGRRAGQPAARGRRSRASRWSGLVGAACALGAAWQAKFHRLAALILLGGAGLVTCVTFVWFSAPDLALTQLLVEIVTTVLLLLGLRWLPKRFDVPGATRGRRRSRTPRRLRDLAHRRRRRRRAWRRSPTR